VKEIKPMKTPLMMLLSGLTLLAGQAATTDEIVARMMEHDQARQSSQGAYTWTSHYVLDNKDRHAEMMVRWTRQPDGTKRYELVYERGDGSVRDYVFHKLLESEVEASQPAFQYRNRLNTMNYSFVLTGSEEIHGRLAYVLEIQPKTDSKYLTKGRIWVDATDYAVIQADGSPSKKPSFWTNSVSFVQTYEKNGDYWMAASNRSVTDAKLFGKADLVITHSGYKFSPDVIATR
jgi:outer membrane lipoprotein-sorting protein